MSSENVTSLPDTDSFENLKQTILDDIESELEEFLKNAGHAAYNSDRKMSASFTTTATIAKKFGKGDEVKYTLLVDSRVRMPSEKIARDIEVDKNGQLSLL